MNKLDDLVGWFDGKDGVIVALSGGVDSALVAYASHLALGDSSLAVTADYKTLAQEELESAKKICQEIGIRHKIISYSELENEDFVRNDKNRCFYCRSELSYYLRQISEEEQIWTIVDGTNIDDLGDYRPGMTALKNNGIKSPLVDVGLTKADIRQIAKRVGLSVYDRPSNSCLASRIPWGQRVTAERLARIEIGERFVRQILGARQVRVRDIEGTARIEVGRDEMHLLSDTSKIGTLVSMLKSIGFISAQIDPDGYRTGKINVIAD